MSQDIVSYLEDHHFAHPVTYESYPAGHGFSQETAPEMEPLIVDEFVDTLAPAVVAKRRPGLEERRLPDDVGRWHAVRGTCRS